MIYTFVYKLMQHVAEQAMQQMFGETNLWEIKGSIQDVIRFPYVALFDILMNDITTTFQIDSLNA